MELTGKIIELLPEQSGESARGPWRKQQYILETDGQYPKKVCFMAWGDKIDEFKLALGDTFQEQNSAPPQSQVAQQVAQDFDEDIPF